LNANKEKKNDTKSFERSEQLENESGFDQADDTINAEDTERKDIISETMKNQMVICDNVFELSGVIPEQIKELK